MRLFFRVFLLICGLVCGLSARAHAQAATMVRGAKSSFMVGAPDGWMLNNAAAQALNVPVAISPKDQSAYPGVVLYVASVPKSPQVRSLADYLVVYRSQIERPGSQLAVTPQSPLKGELGATAQVYYYSGLATQRLEANAFFDNPDSVDIVVLSTPNVEMFKKSLPIFASVVGTYGNTALKPKAAEEEPAATIPKAVPVKPTPTVRPARPR